MTGIFRTLFVGAVLWATTAWAQPVITQQPESLVVSRRGATLTSLSERTARNRWSPSGTSMDRKSPALAVRRCTSPLLPSRAGIYEVVVRDIAGQQRASAPAELQVKPRPRVVVQSRSTIVQEGGTAVFEVQLNDSGPYTKIVWHNSNPLEGSHEIPDGLGFDVHNTRLEIPNCLNAANYNGIYWITVENEVGRTASRKVRLKVVSAPQTLLRA